jgi:hypothetical protein
MDADDLTNTGDTAKEKNMCNTSDDSTTNRRPKRSVIIVHQSADGTYHLEETSTHLREEECTVENSSPLLGLLCVVVMYWCWSYVLMIMYFVLQLTTLPYRLVYQVSDLLSIGISSVIFSLASYIPIILGIFTLAEHICAILQVFAPS